MQGAKDKIVTLSLIYCQQNIVKVSDLNMNNESFTNFLFELSDYSMSTIKFIINNLDFKEELLKKLTGGNK